MKWHRKLLDNDDFMAKVWEFSSSSRNFCNDRCSVSADEISTVGECLTTASRSQETLLKMDESLANTIKSLESLRAA